MLQYFRRCRQEVIPFKIRSILSLLLIIGVIWYFYGDDYERAGFQGVTSEIQSDLQSIKENPIITNTIDTISTGIKELFHEFLPEERSEGQQVEEKPNLESPPSTEIFSIHNVELKDSRADVEAEAGPPKRSSLNEYGVNWVAYHENYQNFFMVAYDDKNQIVGLFTNQDLFTSSEEISMKSNQKEVIAALGEPLDSIDKGLVRYQINKEQAYDVFLLDESYVTIFYDKHENNTITAIQMISKDLEQQKQKYFAEPSEQLKEGFELQLFDLTNAARVHHGLPVLAWNEEVRQTARDHSTDMADHNYFSHTNLAGLSPFDRMKEDHIRFQIAGENLASGQPSSIFAHEGLMNSEGHRENILNNKFETLGIGVAFNQDSQPFYTENFVTN
ncbi:CAP-associated domain-containing protein [Gracilibacillus sp. JCM 18860]|uniref:CAP domain-containing protein n=1 Tax=Gracilibacillus sp. JCM 18860 TaxID=1306159 RepID=UPI000ADD3D33